MKPKPSASKDGTVRFGRTAFGQNVYDYMMAQERVAAVLDPGAWGKSWAAAREHRKRRSLILARALAKAGMLMSPEMVRDAKLGAMVRKLGGREGIVCLGFGLGINGSSCPPFMFAKITAQKGEWQVLGPWDSTPESVLALGASHKEKPTRPLRERKGKKG